MDPWLAQLTAQTTESRIHAPQISADQKQSSIFVQCGHELAGILPSAVHACPWLFYTVAQPSTRSTQPRSLSEGPFLHMTRSAKTLLPAHQPSHTSGQASPMFRHQMRHWNRASKEKKGKSWDIVLGSTQQPSCHVELHLID